MEGLATDRSAGLALQEEVEILARCVVPLPSLFELPGLEEVVVAPNIASLTPEELLLFVF